MADLPRLAVLIPEYPSQTHSFFWREIVAIKDLSGAEVDVLSTRPPEKPVMHHWVKDHPATYLFPVPILALLGLLPLALWALLRIACRRDAWPLLLRPKTYGFIIMAARLWRITRKRGIAHVHVHSCANAAMVAALCHRAFGLPYSLVLHGPFKDYGPDQHFKWRMARFVFVITDKLFQEAIAKFPDLKDKISIAPMGVDTDHFSPGAKARPAKTTPFVWFSCARLNPVKGHDTVTQALGLLKERTKRPFRIVIAGEDDQFGKGYRKELESLIKDAGASDQITLLGAVSQDRVLEELRAADGFVLASRHEPLGVAYMEAMACELPVIGTDAGGVAELIDTGTDGILVPPGDAEALADAMAGIMADEGRAKTLGKAARQKIIDHFGAARSAKAILAQFGWGKS